MTIKSPVQGYEKHNPLALFIPLSPPLVNLYYLINQQLLYLLKFCLAKLFQNWLPFPEITFFYFQFNEIQLLIDPKLPWLATYLGRYQMDNPTTCWKCRNLQNEKGLVQLAHALGAGVNWVCLLYHKNKPNHVCWVVLC